MNDENNDDKDTFIRCGCDREPVAGGSWYIAEINSPLELLN